MSDDFIVLRGEEEHHFYRLGNGLDGCKKEGGFGALIKGQPNFEDNLKYIKSKKYKIAFVEASTDLDLSEVINADRIILFDCEDDPYHFDPKKAYYSLKDKCEFYAKLVYDSTKPVNEDGLKYINIPLDNFTRLREVANIPLEKKSLDRPCFCGVPSYKNFWEPKDEDYYCVTKEFNPVAQFESDNSLIYNQRLDWLVTLAENKVPANGAVVFNEDPNHPHGVEFQAKHFGERIRDFGMEGMPPHTLLTYLLLSKIGLAPTGHDRYSWRVFDLMATGCILLATDLGERRMLYNPKCKVNVHDGENIMEVLERVKSREKMLLDSHLQNREVLKDITPERMWSDFLKQME